MKCTFFWVIFIHSFLVNAQLLTPAELRNNYSASYEECISYYNRLNHSYKEVSILVAGPSDTEFPIHLVVIDKNGYSDPDKIRKKGRTIVLINNGIHPGEPEGIDASMQWARDLVTVPIFKKLLDKTSFIIVPVYNIGGCLRRNKYSRSNQNGPEVYGFRGNRNNLDLNRDFVKQDSKNAQTFAQIFQTWQPDVFMDTHTTDGADYQYNMSLLPGMRSKLPVSIGDYLYQVMLKDIYHSMKAEGDEMIPYVEFDGQPENGAFAFNDKARFGSGYAALFHCIPFVIESHMLKPFNVRLESTSRIIRIISQFVSSHTSEILETKRKAIELSKLEKEYPILWKRDLSITDSLEFKTFEVNNFFYPFLQDSIHGFNTQKKLNLFIPYYEQYKPTKSIVKPKYYIVPHCYSAIIENLKRNGVAMKQLARDSLIQAVYYRIKDYKTVGHPYENHYLHFAVDLDTVLLTYPFLRGDYVISTNQNAVRYIMEVFEPEADDSYFNWNFFDGILMRKEYYSDYAFAEKADSLIKSNVLLQKKFDQFLTSDNKRKNISEKLDFIYKNSEYAEPFVNIYPVARILE